MATAMERRAALDDGNAEVTQSFKLSASYDLVVDAEPSVAFETFKAVAWKELGLQSVGLGMLPEAGVVEKGNEHGVGQIRSVPGRWLPAIHEEILEIIPNELIVYRVKKGAWPASNHFGRVTFEEVEGGKTLITWSAQSNPYKGCFNVVRFFFWFIAVNALRSVNRAIEKKNKAA